MNRNTESWNFALIVLSALAVVGLGACSAPPNQEIPEQYLGGDPDQYRIVDCLLPPQVRRLGTRRVYLAARRASKIPAGNCAVRGGEYVMDDLGSYRFALKAWLPDAESGDPVAQTYVGEIYEKGLDGQPDYATALQWFRRAAAQGFPRAQNRLGQLYELGLGVRADKTTALNWYRKAVGLVDDDLVFGISLDDLRRKLATAHEDISVLREQVRELQRELARRDRNLRRGQAALDKARAELTSARQRRAASAAPVIKPREISELEQRVADSESQLAEISAEKAGIEARQELLAIRLEAERSDKTTLQAEVSRLEGELRALAEKQQSTYAKGKTDLAAERRKLAETQQRLAKTQRQLRVHQVALAAKENAEIERLGEQVTVLEREAQDKQAQINELMARLEQREDVAAQRQLDAERSKYERLATQLASAERALNTHRDALERQTSSEIALLKAQLRQQRNAFSAVQARSDSLSKELSATNRELQDTRAKLEVIQTGKSDIASVVRGSGPIGAAPSPTSTTPPADLDFGHYHALIVGNNRYAAFTNLATAVQDARDVDQVLRTRYGFKTQVLINATRGQMLQALNDFRKSMTDKDNFLLYFAGHGILDEVNSRGHWLPVDAAADDPSQWIFNERVTSVINTMNAKHVMVIADSCYSGTLTRSVTTSIDGARSTEQQRAWLEAMISTRSRTVLTSGGLAPVLDGGGGKNSVFAKHLLQVLWENEELLEGPILFQRVLPRVERAAARLKVEQSPRYSPLRFAGDLGAPFFFRPVGI